MLTLVLLILLGVCVYFAVDCVEREDDVLFPELFFTLFVLHAGACIALAILMNLPGG